MNTKQYYLENMDVDLKEFDTEISDYISDEYKRQRETIQMIAAENISRHSVLSPLSTIVSCKTAEGVVRHRYHAGCSVVDGIEAIAEERGKKLFNSKQVWLQPHSGSTANQIVMFTLLDKYLSNPKKARILSMSLDQGGHLTHGSEYNIAGKLFSIKSYYVNEETYMLDYDEIKKKANEFKPHLIICGASSYPREIDFKRFGEIAEDNDSYLLSDIAHILGLVTAGVHQSPMPHSTFVTSSTYKAGGPRGGIIIAGDKSTEKQRKNMTYGVFPGVQSTPNFASIAAKAIFFKECMTEKYKKTQRQIVRNAKVLSSELIEYGYDVLTGGTDNHKVLVNIKKTHNMTGREAESRLESCGINANKNMIPFDTEKPTVTSGIRFGTNTVTRIGMNNEEMKTIASLINEILTTKPTEEFIKEKRNEVKNLMENFEVTI